jgi:hypothetical protein
LQRGPDGEHEKNEAENHLSTASKRAWRVSVESTGMFNHEWPRGERNGAGRFEAFEAPTITSPTFAADADTFTARS